MGRLLIRLDEACGILVALIDYPSALLELEEGSWVDLAQFALRWTELAYKGKIRLIPTDDGFAVAEQLMRGGQLLVDFLGYARCWAWFSSPTLRPIAL